MASAADPLGQSAVRYSLGAMWFHWVIAVLIAVNLFLGFYHEGFGKAATPWMMFFHKALGITVLGLSVARLLWRVRHRPPPFDSALRPWEALLARITHWLFYVLMIAIPLTGWLLASSSGRATNFFGLFEIAALPVPRSAGSHDLFENLHEWLGKLILGLIALHVAGAAKHHLQGHRHMIGRMGPWLYRKR